MNLILMGPPGVGKGTQGQRLAAAYGIPVVASGDMFRQIRQEDTAEAAQIRTYMDRGEYVPDDLTIAMVLERLNRSDAKRGFILDGFPRTVPQARALDQHLLSESRPIHCVVLLQAADDVILSRLTGRRVCRSCGKVYNQATNPSSRPGVCDACGGQLVQRTDESPDVQRRRLQVYKEQTAPVAAYYDAEGRLRSVDATQPVEKVQSALRSLIDEPVTAS